MLIFSKGIYCSKSLNCYNHTMSKVDVNELIDAIENSDSETLGRLIASGADMSICGEEGKPLLLLAITKGASKEVVKMLLDAGTDLGWTTSEGVGLLDEAIERNRIDLVELFIDYGIDPASTSRESGMTPMMLAASFDYIEIMELLYDKGADIFMVDIYGLGAVDYARKLGRIRAKAWLEEKIADPF